MHKILLVKSEVLCMDDSSRIWQDFILSELQAGKSGLSVVDTLENEYGWDRTVAWQWVRESLQRVGNQDYGSDTRGEYGVRPARILLGLAAIAIGIAITGGTYAAAGPGETYYIVWGPVVYGGWLVLSGLFSSD
jgi:hypothetical protein